MISDLLPLKKYSVDLDDLGKRLKLDWRGGSPPQPPMAAPMLEMH